MADLSFGVRVTGVEQLIKSLQHLSRAIAARVMRKAVTKATAPLLKAVRQAAPVGPKKKDNPKAGGLLKKSVMRKLVSYPGTSVAVVGTSYKRAPHDHLVHDGTRPRFITTLNRGGTKRLKGQRRKFVGVMPANPFVKREFKAHKSQINQTLESEVAAGIQEEAKKAAK